MSYSSLHNYNYYGAESCESIKRPCSAMAVQLIPTYSPPGYDTLTHGPCAYSHLEIGQAYPTNCDKFAARLCDCNLPGSKGDTCAGPVSCSKRGMEPMMRGCGARAERPSCGSGRGCSGMSMRY